MVKKWIDAGEIADADITPKRLWEYEDLMKGIPNFDKSEGAKKIYSKKSYVILEVKKGYIVYNQNKPFEKGHSHLKSFNMSKTIINNCINKKTPKTNNLYLLESHIRISNDDKYKKFIEELIEVKKSKDKLKYVNRGK
jgi:hypothetical protein